MFLPTMSYIPFQKLDNYTFCYSKVQPCLQSYKARYQQQPRNVERLIASYHFSKYDADQMERLKCDSFLCYSSSNRMMLLMLSYEVLCCWYIPPKISQIARMRKLIRKDGRDSNDYHHRRHPMT